MASKYDSLRQNVAALLFKSEPITMEQASGNDACFFVTHEERYEGDWAFTYCATINHKGRSKTTYHDSQIAAVRHGMSFAVAKAREGYERVA